jgi:hypothetical protein
MGQNNILTTGEDGARMSTNVFGLEQLFYMPLKAVIDANTQAAMAAVNIIREYGFDNDKSSENYGQLKMVTFSYNYVGKNGHMQTMAISIPFITLIPLPILEVKHAEIDFALKVLGQLDIDVKTDETQKSSQSLLSIFAPDKSNNAMNLSLEANMNVNIKVGQSDLPGGIIQLLNLGQEATMGDNLIELNHAPNQLNFEAGKALEVAIEYHPKDDFPEDIIFDVTVEPSFKTSEPAFSKPIEIIRGNLYGKDNSWKHIKVIPVVKKEHEKERKKASFILSFTAGLNNCNGFIHFQSNYSKQLKIYFSFN